MPAKSGAESVAALAPRANRHLIGFSLQPAAAAAAQHLLLQPAAVVPVEPQQRAPVDMRCRVPAAVPHTSSVFRPPSEQREEDYPAVQRKVGQNQLRQARKRSRCVALIR